MQCSSRLAGQGQGATRGEGGLGLKGLLTGLVINYEPVAPISTRGHVNTINLQIQNAPDLRVYGGDKVVRSSSGFLVGLLSILIGLLSRKVNLCPILENFLLIR